MNEADRLVERWMVSEFRAEVTAHGSPLGALYAGINRPYTDPIVVHLAVCPETFAGAVDHQRTALWDTMVTGVEWTARIACPHKARVVDLEFSVLGQLTDVFEELDSIKAQLFGPAI